MDAETITSPLDDSQVQLPLEEDERQSLLDFAEGLPEKQFAFRILIESALWNLEQAENDRDVLADSLYTLKEHVNRFSNLLIIWMKSSNSYRDVQREFVELRKTILNLNGRSAVRGE